MPRVMDHRLEAISQQLWEMKALVEDLVRCALNALENPGCGHGSDADRLDEEVNRLERALQSSISIAFVRYQPVAIDHRYLLATVTTTTDLEHMGDSAKRICRFAAEIKAPVISLQLLRQATHQRVSECFTILRQLELLEHPSAAENERLQMTGDSRREVDELLELVTTELGEVRTNPLTARELEAQLLAAVELKRICDYVASVAEQVEFYLTGTRLMSAP